VARLALAAGIVAFALSLALYLYTLSPSLSIVVTAAFIAGGAVGRRRALEPIARAAAHAFLAGGVAGAVAALVLAALES